MRIFAIGDLHLSFSSRKPMDVFGSHWKDHHLLLEKNWRRRVKEDDVVLLPGDISWAMDLEDAAEDLEWIGRLPGRKLMIKGNHDYWWGSISRLEKVLPNSIVPLQHTAYSAGAAVVTGTRGWLTPPSEGFSEAGDGKVYRRELLRLGMALDAAEKLREDRELVVMMHYPPLFSGGPTEFSRMMSDRGVDICVYGHLHMGPEEWPGWVDTELEGVTYRLVSADYLDFDPLELEV